LCRVDLQTVRRALLWQACGQGLQQSVVT